MRRSDDRGRRTEDGSASALRPWSSDEDWKRPVFLNLFKIRQPIGAVASIVHRVSGVLLVLALAPGLYLLERSLTSPTAYADIAAWFDGAIGRVLLLAGVWLFAQHLLSGIRAMLLDMDIGAQLRPARAMAWATFVGSTALTALVAFII